MYYELVLISVLVAGGYWGWYFVRHQPTRLYGALQIGAAALCGLGMLGRRGGEGEFGIPGAIGAGAGICLLVVGPLARGVARRLAGAERFTSAKLFFDIAEVLAPGSGVGHEKDLLSAMREIRDGNIETTVEALTAAKTHAPPDARLAIDERIAMLYVTAYRWDEAISHAEEHLFGAIPPTSEPAAGNALRRALGIAPAAWVELLGAYGYLGELDQAARMLARLEDVCAGRPDATLWLHRGRMMFLALSGRVGAVQELVEPRRSRHMKQSARMYWLAVAHERRGEIAAAEAAYAKARSGSRGRPRVLIDQALARLATAQAVELSPAANEVIARVEAEPPPAVTQSIRPSGPIATRILAGSLVVTAVASAILLGSSTDSGVLVRSGALVHSLVEAGQWWRLFTNLFVHVGWLHLLVNLIGLWIVGRMTEELFGRWKTVAIYALGGIGGAAASLFAIKGPAISAGASGAIMGLLGAVFLELTVHRQRYRHAWSRGVWGSLVVVVLAQVAFDAGEAMTDHWAHGGGFVAGALVGLALSPSVRWKKLSAHVARVIAIAFAAVVIVSFVFAARTSVRDSLVASPKFGVEVVAPYEKTDTSGNIDAYLTGVAERAKREPHNLVNVVPAMYPIVQMPEGFWGGELIGEQPSELGDAEHIRIIWARSATIVVVIYVPDTIVREAPEYFTWLIPRL